ncbi:MAG: hypothetical protein HOO96_24290 [Polyangiaceae bacterium]|nr:hypothetical protein [Polyangiaceae bacterium]
MQDDPKYRGSSASIALTGNQFVAKFFANNSGLPDKAAPGGEVRGAFYDELRGVPDPKTCSGSIAFLRDDGRTPASSYNVGLSTSVVAPLTGLFGNIAQLGQDFLRTYNLSGNTLLAQGHTLDPAPLSTGPLKGESFASRCSGWTPQYAVRDVYSAGDVQLVSAADKAKVRCYISGLTGAWSATRANGAVQPFAEIYQAVGGEIRLRVEPSTVSGIFDDRVGAYASCLWRK